MNSGTYCDTSVLRLEDVTAYIRKMGWEKLEHPNNEILVYQYESKDEQGENIKLVLPSKNMYSDTKDKIETAVELLSAIEHLTTTEMIYKIRNRGFDILRQRLYNNTSKTNLSLETATQVIQKLRDLIFQAACAEENPQPYFEKGKKIGKSFTQKCRFGHTFHGSFGLSVEMPIPPNSYTFHTVESKEMIPIPMERRIMERIVRGLRFSEKAANEGDVNILTKNFDKGFNANLCEVMTQLTGYLEDFNIEFSMFWSSEYNVNKELVPYPKISIDPSVIRPFYESAAKTLRSEQESIETVIKGRITQLKAERIDETDDRKSDDKQITVHCVMDSGRKINIRISLNTEDYRTACDAHKNGNMIEVKGIPEKQNKFWILTSPSNFTILSD